MIEATLASCMNITLRMYAEQYGMAASGVTTRVRLDRSQPEETSFAYGVELQGEPSETDRACLLDVAAKCPVRRTLSKRMAFHTTTQTP